MAKAVHPTTRDTVEPDYTAAVEEVFTSFTKMLLETLPYRRILSLVTDKPQHTDYVERLPSWVPDFATSIGIHYPVQTMLTIITRAIPDLSAGSDDPKSSHLEIKDGKLKVFARPCGHLDFTFRVSMGLSKTRTLSEGFLRAMRMVTDLLEACTSLVQKGVSSLLEPMFRVTCWGAPSIETDDDFRAHWKKFLATAVSEPRFTCPGEPTLMAPTQRLMTLFDGLSGMPSIPVESDIVRIEVLLAYSEVDQPEESHEFETVNRDFAKQWPETFNDKETLYDGFARLWPEFFADGKDIQDQMATFHDVLEELDKFYRVRLDPRVSELDTLFTTSKSNVGRVTGTLQPGDELWLICQAKVPFVLRPMPNDEYVLVGEAFVHNGMQGQLIETGVAEKPRLISII